MMTLGLTLPAAAWILPLLADRGGLTAHIELIESSSKVVYGKVSEHQLSTLFSPGGRQISLNLESKYRGVRKSADRTAA